MSLNIAEQNNGATFYSATENTVFIKGDIDQHDPSSFLASFFKDVLKSAVESNFKELNIDIRQLNYVNSSGVKTFIIFLVGLMALPAEQRFFVNFISNKEITWQNAILAPLRVMAPNYVRSI